MKERLHKFSSAAIPYVAVLVGLYVMKNAWVAMGLYHLGIALVVSSGDRGKLLPTVRSGWNTKAGVASVIVCSVGISTIYILWDYIRLENMCLKTALASLGLSGLSWCAFMIYFSTVQPVLEELYWRDYLRSGRNGLAWVDVAFAGYHVLVLARFIRLPWLAASFAVLAAASCGWRCLARRFEGLAIPLVSHIAADMSIIAVTNVLIR